ncbi:MAG: DUF3375 family protein [Legionellales bacterium]|nr:DUF3375 family protein [Legionellales bacterium]
MEFERVLFHTEHSATLRLLRSKHAPFAMSFFFFAFKKKGRLQIPYSELKELLTQFLENLDDEAKKEHSLTAQQFLDLWSHDHQGFIRKYFELNQDEPVTELTADTERALEWMRNLEKKEFVGTQSRFLSIYENMKQIADQTEENPQSRLSYLKDQRKKLDEEIKQIQTTGVVSRMDGTQIRERFLNLIEDSRRLISEFRLIEDIFKDITRKIKEKKLKEVVTKGEILREVLDAHDALEESDQGRSFAAFWQFLISDDQQNQLKKFSQKILDTPEIKEFVRRNPDRQLDTSLLKLKSQLLQVGQKVLKSKFRLSEELRKLLHQKALIENRRVLELSADIKKLLLENSAIFLNTVNKEFTTLQNGLEIQLPLSRPLWQPSNASRFIDQQLETSENNDQALEDLTALVNTPLINEAELEARIEKLLSTAPQISLSQVVQLFPVQFGTAEILCYLLIAARTDHHIIRFEQTEKIFCHDREIAIVVPSVIFVRKSNEQSTVAFAYQDTG